MNEMFLMYKCSCELKKKNRSTTVPLAIGSRVPISMKFKQRDPSCNLPLQASEWVSGHRIGLGFYRNWNSLAWLGQYFRLCSGWPVNNTKSKVVSQKER
jgi:hypothetical protein